MGGDPPSPKRKLYSLTGIANFTLTKPEYNASLGAYLNYEHRICNSEGFMLTYTFYKYTGETNKGALVWSFQSLYSLDRHLHAFNSYLTGGIGTWLTNMINGFEDFGNMLTIIETSSSNLEIDYFNTFNGLNYLRAGFDTVGTIDTCEIV